jgi:hypothetical protein
MEAAVIAQVGFVKEEALEIIDLVNNFVSSADFAQWVTDGRFAHTIIKEGIEDGKYARASQYDLDGSIFFNGRGEFCIDLMPRKAIKALMQNHSPIYSSDPSYEGVVKTSISKTIAEPYYTVISQLHVKTEVVGTVWEIYNLPRLIKIYKNKDDPIRYWRNSRRG